MKEVLDDIERWRADGHQVAIARVVGTEGSSPRDPGATMAVSDTGEVAGSGSGGGGGGGGGGEGMKNLARGRGRGGISFCYSHRQAISVGGTRRRGGSALFWAR